MTYYNDIILAVVRVVSCLISILVSAVVIPWLKNTVVPYLKDRHLYSMVCKFVMAAEKMADVGTIEKDTKKTFVLDMLRSRGVTITGEVEALIEAAVEELDLETMEAVGGIVDVFSDDDIVVEADGEESASDENEEL